MVKLTCLLHFEFMSSDTKAPATHSVPVAAIDPIYHNKNTASETEQAIESFLRSFDRMRWMNMTVKHFARPRETIRNMQAAIALVPDI